MAFEQELHRWEVLFVGAVLGLAWISAGCTRDEEEEDPRPALPSVLPADAGLEKGFQDMYQNLSPEDRAVLDDEIMKRKDVLIHIIRGNLFTWESRGGSSTPHSGAEKDGRCSRSQHPDVKGVPKRRDWDLVYDEQRAEEESKESGILNPIDVVLYHEIFGHIVPILRNPKILDDTRKNKKRYDEFEDEARAIENRYRQRRLLRLFPVPPKGSTP